MVDEVAVSIEVAAAGALVDAELGVKPEVSAWPNSFPFTNNLFPRILMSDFNVLACSRDHRAFSK